MVAPNVGRAFTITQASAVIMSGIQTKSVEAANEAVDITNDDSAGWQDILEVPGKKSMNINLNGVSKDASLRDTVMSGTNCMLEDITVNYIDGESYTGNWFLSGITYDGDHADAVKFSATLLSSGPITLVTP